MKIAYPGNGSMFSSLRCQVKGRVFESFTVVHRLSLGAIMRAKLFMYFALRITSEPRVPICIQ